VDPAQSTVLDVGCGSAKHVGAFGLDIRSNAHADLVHDLRSTPWPVPADHYEQVLCHDIIEHMSDTGAFVREVYRVCAPGAVVEIRTPHFSSWYAYNDPTHLHSFGYFFLDHFTTENTTLSSGGGCSATLIGGFSSPARTGSTVSARWPIAFQRGTSSYSAGCSHARICSSGCRRSSSGVCRVCLTNN
jgi:hypothetical protein